jgi:hypothetical protein
MKFVAPKMEIMWFGTEDILTTSEVYEPTPPMETDCPEELPLM